MARSSHAQPNSQRAAAVGSGMSSGPVDVVVQHGSGTVNRRMGGHGRRLTHPNIAALSYAVLWSALDQPGTQVPQWELFATTHRNTLIVTSSCHRLLGIFISRRPPEALLCIL